MDNPTLYRLYDYALSGNCYKVRLLLKQLEQAFERVAIDILRGETNTPEFTAKNALQKVPVLELPDGRHLTESNAILFYLAEGTPYLPDDAWQRAQVLRWQSFEQFSVVPYIGALRFWHLSNTLEQHHNALESKLQQGNRALRIMDQHLAANDFFVDDRYTIADIALYAYTHVAPEGGFDLAPYPHVRAWIARVGGQPRHVTIAD